MRKRYNNGGILSGAASGASIGTSIAPGWGTLIGAIGGGIMGAANTKKQENLQYEQERANQENYLADLRNYSQTVLRGYPTQGVAVSGYYMKNGGRLPSFLTNALAEGGEVAVSDTLPITDQNGMMDPLASNVSQFEGDLHSDPSGGIGFNSTSDTMIFSDSLRTSEGLTFAKAAEIIGRKKGKFEKKLESARDEAAHNTATRMIEKLDRKLDNLFMEQELLKQNEI